MPSQKALEMAARCWCDEETKNCVMDERLALAFAKRLDLFLKVAQTAQGVLTALNVGDMPSECLLHEHLRKTMIEHREQLAIVDPTRE